MIPTSCSKKFIKIARNLQIKYNLQVRYWHLFFLPYFIYRNFCNKRPLPNNRPPPPLFYIHFQWKLASEIEANGTLY